MKTFLKVFGLMFLVVTMSVGLSSCGHDEDEPKAPSIVGTWECQKKKSNSDSYDNYTLVFNKDYTGYLNNEFGSRASLTMHFDWSLVLTSNGLYLLSVIYKSGDRNIEGGPFEDNYAQYTNIVTIAGNTLSIQLDDEHVMLFTRKK